MRSGEFCWASAYPWIGPAATTCRITMSSVPCGISDWLVSSPYLRLLHIPPDVSDCKPIRYRVGTAGSLTKAFPTVIRSAYWAADDRHAQ